MTKKITKTQQAFSVVKPFVDEWLPRSDDNLHAAFGNWAVEQVLWNDNLTREQILDVTSCDGKGDCGIDGWYVTGDGDTSTVSIFQNKDTPPQKEDLNKLIDGFTGLFGDSFEMERDQANTRILDLADGLDELLASGDQIIEIDCWIITSRIAQQGMRTRAESLAQSNPTVKLNGQECVVRYHVLDIIDLQEGIQVLHNDPIDESFTVDNKDCFIFETKNKIRTISLQMEGKLLARWFQKYRTNLFRLNPRYYQGSTSKYNSQILKTVSDKTDALNFYVYNNGITILCGGVGIEDKGNNRTISVRDLQIVNGCQTTATIHYAWKLKRANINDINVPVRIIESHAYAEKIAEFTNSQTPMKDSDFKSNDPIQERLSKSFLLLDPPWFYEHKRGVWNTEYKTVSKQRPFKIGPKLGLRKMTKEDVAQACFAFLGKASQAQEAPRFVWNSKTYSDVFPSTITTSQLLLPYHIFLESVQVAKIRKAQDVTYANSLKFPSVYLVSEALRLLRGKTHITYPSDKDSQLLIDSREWIEYLLEAAFDELSLEMDRQLDTTQLGVRSTIRKSDWFKAVEGPYINRVRGILRDHDRHADRQGIEKSDYGFRSSFPFEIVDSI